MIEWKDIKEAPKDGTKVLVLTKEFGDEYSIHIAAYEEDFYKEDLIDWYDINSGDSFSVGTYHTPLDPVKFAYINYPED